MTMNQVKQMVEDRGFKVVDARCWEDENWIYAFSIETIPNTYGHPRCEIGYNKHTQYTTVHC